MAGRSRQALKAGPGAVGDDRPNLEWTASLGADGEALPRGSGRDAEGYWDITVGFTQVGERLYPSHVALGPGLLQDAVPVGGITARLLHSVKLGALIDQFRREHEGDRAAAELFFGRRTRPKYKLPPKTNRPGPKGLGEEFYQDVAAGYLRAVARDPRRPIEVLAGSYPGYSKTNVRDWVQLARHKGYLTSPGKGRGGGEPTTKLIAALKARGKRVTAPKRGGRRRR